MKQPYVVSTKFYLQIKWQGEHCLVQLRMKWCPCFPVFLILFTFHSKRVCFFGCIFDYASTYQFILKNNDPITKLLHGASGFYGPFITKSPLAATHPSSLKYIFLKLKHIIPETMYQHINIIIIYLTAEPHNYQNN